MSSCSVLIAPKCCLLRSGWAGVALLMVILAGCQGSCDKASPSEAPRASKGDAGLQRERAPDSHPGAYEAAQEDRASAAEAASGTAAPASEARQASSERRRARAQAHLDRLADVIEAVSKESGHAPASLYDLVEPAKGQPVLAQPDLRDPWGNDVLYTLHEGGRFELRSVGSDNAWGGGDDLVLSRP